jgi:D-alanyl-D-alanine carboxypeptidase
MTCRRASGLPIALGSVALAAVLAAPLLTAATPARAEAYILVDADSGKVLRAENATYPWYPASTSKLMTLYVILSAIRDNRITFDTLFTVSREAWSQSPTKMGFPIGTQVTVDNAIKMLMVKSANDMAVLLAEGLDGSVDKFAEEMTLTAQSLGMTESNFVNPNGLPADGQISSPRDLAILARALIKQFPQYSFYWHIPAIKYGRRIVRNYNPLLGRYPGTDGMKTGFICASGFNLVATATRDNRHLIAVVMGAPSGAARAMKGAELLESGFRQNPLAWLTPSLGTVDELKPLNVDPPNLKDQMCGPHRKRAPAEDEDLDEETAENGNGSVTAGSVGAGDAGSSQFSTLLSALRAPTPKNLNLLSDLGPVVPVVVYTGPTRAVPPQEAEIAPVRHAKPRPKAKKPKLAAAPADEKPAAAKPKPAAKPKAAAAEPKPKAAPKSKPKNPAS